jgi:isopenicillin-N N-acyltransferase-like protein
MRKVAAAALVLSIMVAAASLVHTAIRWSTAILPPPVQLPAAGSMRGYSRKTAGLTEVFLEGSPEQIGEAHSRLLRHSMVADEAELWGAFREHVPWWIARMGIEDFSRVRFRHVDAGIPEPRRRELAAEALAFQPDPFESNMPTYQRMTFLHALYDIALPFEHSPLIGCTSFALDPGSTADGHALMARAFDFEAGDSFDRDKAVFLVREDGAIPFASVAWPGFVGVVTGMNAYGVVAVVHGGRAREPVADGMPVAFSLREVLEHATDTDSALEILRGQSIMVSHIVFVADASGHFAVVERAPGVPAFVRETRTGPLAVTNHFEGPLAADPRNLRVRESTTTLARRERIDELIASSPAKATPSSMLGMLRDHECFGDPSCKLGDRRAIDALIATHGIVADATDDVLWVSAGPRLSGKFVRLNLRSMLAAGYDPTAAEATETLPEDRLGVRGASAP